MDLQLYLVLLDHHHIFGSGRINTTTQGVRINDCTRTIEFNIKLNKKQKRSNSKETIEKGKILASNKKTAQTTQIHTLVMINRMKNEKKQHKLIMKLIKLIMKMVYVLVLIINQRLHPLKHKMQTYKKT